MKRDYQHWNSSVELRFFNRLSEVEETYLPSTLCFHTCLISTFGSSRRHLWLSEFKLREWPFHSPSPPSIPPLPRLPSSRLDLAYHTQQVPSTGALTSATMGLDSSEPPLPVSALNNSTPAPTAREVFPKGQQILSPPVSSLPQLLEKVLSSAYKVE